MKTKIPSMAYNAMFKAVFYNNEYLLKALIKSILDYYDIDIDLSDKEIIKTNNYLSTEYYRDKQFVCDFNIIID